MTFSSYMEVNILLDILIIGLLSFLVLPHAPKFFVFLVCINLLQYGVQIPYPQSYAEGMRFAWNSKPQESSGDPLDFSTVNPAQNPMQLIGRAGAAIGVVSQAMGGAGLPDPSEQSQSAGQNERQPRLSAADQLREAIQDQRDREQEGPRQISLSPRTIMIDAFRDPHAAWLFIRLFWLGAAGYLALQRAVFGSIVACASLVPVPFFAQAVPYAMHRINSNETIQAANASLEHPETIAEYAKLFWFSHGITMVLLTVAIIGSILVFTRFNSMKTNKTLRQFSDYLNPDQYWLRLNGELHEFRVEGSEILVADLRFPVTHVAGDKQNRGRWIIGPHTTVDFISKEEPTQAPQSNTPGYSYRRK
ncbi:MAG: hypothetical protein AAF558_09385 [Verrucomicrobiota bacterium]